MYYALLNKIQILLRIPSLSKLSLIFEHQLAKGLLDLALPTVLGGVVEILLPIITALFIGHQGKEELAAVALGSMLCNASAFAIGLGIAVALDSLCAQAFGARHWGLVGRHAQRMMVILTLLCIPIALFWWYTRPFLELLGIEKTVASYAQDYTRALVPGMWPYFMYDCYRRYLQSQTIAWPVTSTVVLSIRYFPLILTFLYSLLLLQAILLRNLGLVFESFINARAIVTALHVPVTYGFIVAAKLGPAGAGFATVIAYWGLFIFLLLTTFGQRAYLRYMGKLESNPLRHLRTATPHPLISVFLTNPREDTWPSPFSREIFKDWWPLFRLGLPSAASLFVEWGSWEFNAAISGRLGNVELATHSVLNQMSSIFWAVPWGIAVASATLAGNSLGAGDGLRAKRFSHLAYLTCMAVGLIEVTSTFFYRSYVGKIFSDDPAVIAMSSAMIPLFFCYGLLDVFKTTGMTFLRSTGRPAITAWGVIGACLCIGYPLSIGMGLYTSMRLYGVWLGMSAAWMSSGALYAVVIYRTDWNEQVNLAEKAQRDALHEFSSLGLYQIAGSEGAQNFEFNSNIRLSDSEDDSLEG